MIYKLIFALLIGALVMMSCSNYGTNSEDDPNVTVEATFSSIQANVFNKSCALSGCHDSGSRRMCLIKVVPCPVATIVVANNPGWT